MTEENFVEPEWDPMYVKMLDAVGEYLDSMGEREGDTPNQRDIRIIRALIEFYDFEPEYIHDIMEDVLTRTEQLERLEEEEKKNEH